MYYIEDDDDDDDARLVRINSEKKRIAVEKDRLSNGKQVREEEKESETREWQNDGSVLRTMENNFVKNILLILHNLHGGQSERVSVSEYIIFI